MSEYDSPWKEALDLSVEFFLAFFFPQAHADIDWSRAYERLETELQQVVREAALGPQPADKLVKVWLRGGEEAWILIHVEVQSQEEAEFPRRMFSYNTGIFDLYNHTVISLAVLGDDRASRRPDRFGYARWARGVTQRHHVLSEGPLRCARLGIDAGDPVGAGRGPAGGDSHRRGNRHRPG
jgi:hypothetical protein